MPIVCKAPKCWSHDIQPSNGCKLLFQQHSNFELWTTCGFFSTFVCGVQLTLYSLLLSLKYIFSGNMKVPWIFITNCCINKLLEFDSKEWDRHFWHLPSSPCPKYAVPYFALNGDLLTQVMGHGAYTKRRRIGKSYYVYWKVALFVPYFVLF